MTLSKKCNAHLKQLGIKNPEAIQGYIKQIFENSNHQDEVVITIYKMILPEWDNIEKLNGHPIYGRELWGFICDLFIKFDQQYHPECMAGGGWVNFGFSSDHETSPWEIDLSECSITYKEVHNNVEYSKQRASG